MECAVTGGILEIRVIMDIPALTLFPRCVFRVRSLVPRNFRSFRPRRLPGRLLIIFRGFFISKPSLYSLGTLVFDLTHDIMPNDTLTLL
jgi:hypothetical protein